MALLASHRRFWFPAVLAVLALPMLVQAMTPRQTVSEREARALAAAPGWPRTLPQALALPRATEAFLGDHFGLRDRLVHANARLRYVLSSPSNPGVIYGRGGRLFFNGDGMLEQSLGLLRRQADVDKFADFAASLAEQYRARGVRFLVAIPPNSATIERQFVPAWFKPTAQTEYDLMLAALARRNVPHVDLRVPLIAINERQPVYLRTDTHWNRLGALLAYNEVVASLGKADWIVDPNQVFRGFEPRPGGDLARMLGAPDAIGDEDARIDLAAYGPVALTSAALDTRKPETGGNVSDSGRAGPNVVLLGDSFTEHAWRDYFGLHARRLAWIHHELCDFFPDVVDAQRPDIVILAPTERVMFCWNRH
jgi:alginate O-acetyltransferase complex protein AlgJ